MHISPKVDLEGKICNGLSLEKEEANFIDYEPSEYFGVGNKGRWNQHVSICLVVRKEEVREI